MADGIVDMRMGCGSGLLYENFGWWVVCDKYDIRWLCRRGWYLVAGSWFTMFGDVLTSTVTSILLWCLPGGWSLRFGRGNQVVVASFVLLLWLYFFGFFVKSNKSRLIRAMVNGPCS